MFHWDSVLWTYLAYILILCVIIALYYRTTKTKSITEGQLIVNINQSFIQHSDIHNVYIKLDLYRQSKQQKLSEADMPHIIAYLNLFSVIYSLYKRKVLNFSLIDSVFSYRFFLAVNNPFIQRYLLSHHEHHQDLFNLYEQWLNYRRLQRKNEPFSEHSLSLMLGRGKSADDKRQRR